MCGNPVTIAGHFLCDDSALWVAISCLQSSHIITISALLFDREAEAQDDQRIRLFISAVVR